MMDDDKFGVLMGGYIYEAHVMNDDIMHDGSIDKELGFSLF
jgi:hypothetical protein